MENPQLSFLGFVDGVKCFSCGIVLSSVNYNPYIHRHGCLWIRAVYALIVSYRSGLESSNPYLS